jgi:hypothetical protein
VFCQSRASASEDTANLLGEYPSKQSEKMKLSEQLNIKLQPTDMKLVVAAASQRDESPGVFARTALVAVAREVLSHEAREWEPA